MSPSLVNPYTAFVIDLMVDVLLKGTIVLALAGLATWFLRRTSASMRHAVWSLALGSLLALPLLQATLPEWRVEPLYVSLETSAASFENGESSACDCGCGCGESGEFAAAPYVGDSGRGAGGAGTAATDKGAGVGGAAGPSAAGIALFLWAVGAIVLLGRLGRDLFRVRDLTRRARQWGSDEDRALGRLLAAKLRIHRRVRLLESDEVSVPVTWGLRIPAVIFPTAAATWTSERKRVVLLHELAHIRRWDYAVHLMVEVACAVYWFNPFVWLAARLNSLEQERACDDQALNVGVRSDIYAEHLVDIARTHVAEMAPRGAFAMAHSCGLADRVRSILARGLDRAPLSPRRLLSTSVTALAVAFPLASVDIWGAAGVEVVRAFQNGDAEQRVSELEDDDPLVRRHAAWALGELESSRGVDPLIDRLGDDDADVRLVAAWALGEIKEHEAIEPLIDLLEDDDPLVREMAVLALGEIGHPYAVSPMMDAVEGHAELREAAFWALGEIDGDRASDARRELNGRRDPHGWENDEVWTGHLGTQLSRSVSRDVTSVIAVLQDEDPRVRRSAAEWLGERGDPQAVEPLLAVLRDSEPAVRAMAVWALDEINPTRYGT
jgi:HEAT repeat protein